MRKPAIAGPIILPKEKPESKRAKALLLSLAFVISAIQAPEAGLVALPKIPLITLARINKKNRAPPVITDFCPNEIVLLKRIKDIAKPTRPIIITLFLPIWSLSLPQ